MATSTTPPVRRPFERTQREQDQPYTLKVGLEFYLQLNEAPFWESPSWGTQVFVTIRGIRDLATDPLTAGEFAAFATQNVGRYLIAAEWTNHYDDDDKDVGRCQFFWNDCQIETYWGEDGKHYQLEPDSPDQPFAQPALQICFRGSDLGHVYGPTMAERLKLVETLGRLRQEAEGDPLDNFRVRPVV